MRSIIVAFVLFFGCALITLLWGAAGDQDIHTITVRTLTEFTNWFPCVVILILGLSLAGWIINGFIDKSETHGADTPLRRERERTGDSFDPNSIRTGDAPNTYTVNTVRGRRFVVSSRNGKAFFQEIDTRGNSIGNMVVENVALGKDSKKKLAEHLKQKVEFKPPERHHEDYPDHYY